MKITFYGHASIGIEVGGKHILVDPFISANPLAENVDINTIKADYILLTHAHGDHILDVEATERTKAVIVSNAEIAELLCDQRVSSPSYESRWKLEF
jgi:L-ascorbate metabolism protein UlaG (beta-lactamase superfamily)